MWFVTQNPLDVPDAVLGQLGNRVQHTLRAFTPRDQKAVRAAAETFRARPGLDVVTAITELGVGEALVSCLDERGTPRPVERASILPPRSRLAPLTAEERREVLAASPLRGRYDAAVDRESAYERLKQRAAAAAAPDADADSPGAGRAPGGRADDAGGELADALAGMARSAARAAGTQLGRAIVRGVLGTMFGGGGRRRRG